MKPGAGKRKGSAFERKVCQQLSLWVTDGNLKDCFWRSAMSGGRATLGAKSGVKLSRQAGDICSVSPEGHALTERYYLELKHLKSLDLGQFFIKRGGVLAKFWLIARSEARKYGKSPMIIAKQNKYPTIVITRRNQQPVANVLCSGADYEIGLFDDMLAGPFKDFGR